MSLQWPPEEPRGVGAFGCEPTSFFLCVCVPDPSEVSIMSWMGRMMALSATVTTRWGLDRPARRGARNLSEHFFQNWRLLRGWGNQQWRPRTFGPDISRRSRGRTQCCHRQPFSCWHSAPKMSETVITPSRINQWPPFLLIYCARHSCCFPPCWRAVQPQEGVCLHWARSVTLAPLVCAIIQLIQSNPTVTRESVGRPCSPKILTV